MKTRIFSTRSECSFQPTANLSALYQIPGKSATPVSKIKENDTLETSGEDDSLNSKRVGKM